jgi:hypothetical protein
MHRDDSKTVHLMIENSGRSAELRGRKEVLVHQRFLNDDTTVIGSMFDLQ